MGVCSGEGLESFNSYRHDRHTRPRPFEADSSSELAVLWRLLRAAVRLLRALLWQRKRQVRMRRTPILAFGLTDAYRGQVLEPQQDCEQSRRPELASVCVRACEVREEHGDGAGRDVPQGGQVGHKRVPRPARRGEVRSSRRCVFESPVRRQVAPQCHCGALQAERVW